MKQVDVMVVPLIVSMVIALYIGGIVVYEINADYGDALCEKALGEGATYLDEQPTFDRQLDCVASNGTVVRDVNPPAMNFTQVRS